MRIDYQDGRPIYGQIVDYYKKLILRGVMAPDEQLPSVRSLAVELSANPNTVQRAYVELEREGFVYSVKGRGSFVRKDSALREKKAAELREGLRRILREAGDSGIDPRLLIRELQEEYGAALPEADTARGKDGRKEGEMS